MSKHSKEEAELERIAKEPLAMPHTDRDKTKFKTRAKKEGAEDKKKAQYATGLG